MAKRKQPARGPSSAAKSADVAIPAIAAPGVAAPITDNPAGGAAADPAAEVHTAAWAAEGLAFATGAVEQVGGPGYATVAVPEVPELPQSGGSEGMSQAQIERAGQVHLILADVWTWDSNTGVPVHTHQLVEPHHGGESEDLVASRAEALLPQLPEGSRVQVRPVALSALQVAGILARYGHVLRP